LERLGELPEQTQPDESEQEDEKYHDAERLIKIASWAILLSWGFLAFAVLLVLLNMGLIIVSFSAPSNLFDLVGTSFRIVASFLTPLVSLFFFILLRAIAEGIYLLMDVEVNTRDATTK
jgi:hypothetical protein